MAKTGVQTLAKNCPWWPRLMPLTFAAGYLGMNLARFHAVPELEKLIHTAGGQRVVDKTDLDAWIENNKNQQIGRLGIPDKDLYPIHMATLMNICKRIVDHYKEEDAIREQNDNIGWSENNKNNQEQNGSEEDVENQNQM